MIITVFPGQGSQTPGFLAPWLELDGARERLEQFSSDAGVDLVAAGTEWDADRIRDTQVAQPLIVAASLERTSVRCVMRSSRRVSMPRNGRRRRSRLR